MFLSVALLMAAAVLALILTIREKKLAGEQAGQEPTAPRQSTMGNGPENSPMPGDVRKSLYYLLASIFLWFTAYNAVTTAFSRYAGKVWGMQGGCFANALLVATGAAIISYIPIGFVSSAIGRKKTSLLLQESAGRRLTSIPIRWLLR